MQAQSRKLKYHVAMSLDGFIAREDGSTDCFPATPQDEHVVDYFASLALEYDTVLMGRGTYEPGLKYGVTDPYPGLEPYVFSRTLKEIADPRVHLVREDAAGVVRQLKARSGKTHDLSTLIRGAPFQLPKDIYLCGGGQLARTLLAEGLIDEVILKLNPVVLGAGIPFVAGPSLQVGFELLSTKSYRNGVVLLHYAVKR